MSASLFELLKYAQTGIASPSMTFYDKMRASVLMGGGRAKTLTGIPPLTLEKSAGKPLKSWSMIGNIVQDGTPTQDNPVEVKMTGDRTGNLWDEEYLDGYYNSSNTFIRANNQICSKSKIAVKPNTTYWLGVHSSSTSAFLGVLTYNENAEFIERVNTESYIGNGTFITTNASTYYININFGAYYGAIYNDDIMIAESSTPIQYEPYGYKTPFVARGKNLCPPFETYMEGYVAVNGTIGKADANNKEVYTDFIEVNPSNAYVFSFGESGGIFPGESTASGWRAIGCYDADKNFIIRYGGGGTSPFYRKIGELPENTRYVRLTCRTYGKTKSLQFESGTSVTAFEPYRSPTTTPIYLGQTPTVRRVMKFVLDGTEDWIMSNSRFFLSSLTPDYLRGANQVLAVCSHYSSSPQTNSAMYVPAGCISFNYAPTTQRLYCYDTSITTRADFKAYLAAQYAAGTPVTIWYVLAEPETGIVNEPLAKIGDYADELHSEDAAVTIPTLKGTTIIDVDTEVKPTEMTVEYLV